MDPKDLHAFLEEKTLFYNRPSFIENDPICIPHLFSKKEDIEIAGFLVATIAWGKRSIIINNGHKLMQLLENDPHSYITVSNEKEFNKLGHFVHRTFNQQDLLYFLRSLRNIYLNHGGLEKVFSRKQAKESDLGTAIFHFRNVFFSSDLPGRTAKHVSNPMEGSSAKRIAMFLRWMVRNDKAGVDFGIWKGLKPSQLVIPLDVHSGRIARMLGLLSRKQDDWKAVTELTQRLREFDPIDPVKYDYALFGLGVNEAF